jgi:putative transposase
MWNLAPPPGFQGLRDEIPMRGYTRHMPHWRQAGSTYFVTFRLADSIPENRLRELESLKKDWELRNPLPRSNNVLQQLARMIFEKIEYWLD